MIETRNRRILVDGVPTLVLAGEIHYFRVPRAGWEQRIELAVEAGCTAVASYIPWLWHELPDGSIDVTGSTRPERDVGAFIDLCARHGLQFIARPGPFIMAELKNEGLPYRLYREHPEIVATGWDGAPATTATVDYLAPAYLAECRRWFDAVLPVIAARLHPAGPVIAVQLDNEIGMLAWISNSPDLTDDLLADFAGWLRRTHGAQAAVRYPVDPADPVAWRRAIESPGEDIAGDLRVDLPLFMRDRFARYVDAAGRPGRRQRRHRRSVPDQHPRNGGRQRGTVRHRRQPAAGDLARQAGIHRWVGPLPWHHVVGHHRRHPLRQRHPGRGQRHRTSR